MSKISLKHTDGNVVSLNSPTNAPDQADVAFKLPNADGSAGQALVTDGSGNLSFSNVAGGSAKNLIINGAMLVAQRGTSSTSTGYASVDRFNLYHANTGVTITQSQQSSASSDTPYTLGFRNFFRMALASAGTANANAEIGLYYNLEAQDVANSGWNHTSSTSNITLSFWFRCSTNQTFYAYLRTRDGTNYTYPFSFTASGNNAWTKITKTIPGNSNLQIDNDNERGLSISIIPFYGTDLTNNLSLDQWSAYDTANRMPDMASTWLTAGASTFDITGIQLEVGSVATDFEHRLIAQELLLCQRYYQRFTSGGNTYRYLCLGTMDDDGSSAQIMMTFRIPFRSSISSMDTTGSASDYAIRLNSTQTCTAVPLFYSGTEHSCYLVFEKTSVGWSTGQCVLALLATTGSYLGFSAEL